MKTSVRYTELKRWGASTRSVEKAASPPHFLSADGVTTSGVRQSGKKWDVALKFEEIKQRISKLEGEWRRSLEVVLPTARPAFSLMGLASQE
ncbi:hypothetical protein AOLI_G00144160 [Acnodon oligacanthus]